MSISAHLPISFRVVQHLPEWAPGAGFLRKAREWRTKVEEFVDGPYEFVKESIVRIRPHTPSVCFKRLT